MDRKLLHALLINECLLNCYLNDSLVRHRYINTFIILERFGENIN